ncbi:DUF1566 domain-containing protein [Aquitalea magnusonii]|uniref:Uncharacterized protein DUF1566 n=1 Tax=Aquitalea magnusonii TaxID=332411 RepID=A0A318JLV0_9NEIS|nr:DUF1566 domain-containing protein [Aquitalea magnusonii]PXX49407.1 uncharacterized protein DUF1566 [Aquitalea magnusonii]
MNAPKPAVPAVLETPAIGEAFEGGFFAGRIRIGSNEFALIVSPKAPGETDMAWGPRSKDIKAARSCFDGMANTSAMAEAGSELAKWALALNIGGHADWYIPSRDELEICYRNLKPTGQENYCSFRDGDNASSIPAGFLYTEQSPAQTAVSAFQDENAEAFDCCWYWASTQYSPGTAWSQDFSDGYQDLNHEGIELRARAVRRILIL